MKQRICVIVGSVVGIIFASTAYAECTPAEIQIKSAEISVSLQQLATTDPVKMQEVAEMMQVLMRSAASTASKEDDCAALDTLIAAIGE